VEELYEICEKARKILTGRNSVSRVIARPFEGQPGNFKRLNSARKDFSLEPVQETLLDILVKNNKSVIGIGKIGDIFNHRGLTRDIKTKDNEDGINKTIKYIKENRDRESLIFTNLVEFDSVYGHRRNVEGYARALKHFDDRLPEIQENMGPEDIMFITADHGCDPTYGEHTDHTREYVPLLVYGDQIKAGVDLGIRKTFADCGQTIADIMGMEELNLGESFKGKIIKNQ
ncbi:MAG: phosphopentomutase, partial [Elusimicrobiota bacterium]